MSTLCLVKALCKSEIAVLLQSCLEEQGLVNRPCLLGLYILHVYQSSLQTYILYKSMVKPPGVQFVCLCIWADYMETRLGIIFEYLNLLRNDRTRIKHGSPHHENNWSSKNNMSCSTLFATVQYVCYVKSHHLNLLPGPGWRNLLESKLQNKSRHT